MFDSVAIPADARRRFGAPAAVSVALHLLVAALVPAMTRLQAAAARSGGRSAGTRAGGQAGQAEAAVDAASRRPGSRARAARGSTGRGAAA